MKLINTALGRFVLLVAGDDIRPLSRVHQPSAFEMLKQRYAFAYAPALRLPWDKVQKDGFKFLLGKLVIGGKQINIAELGIYSDGVVVSAATTDDAEIFLDDLLEWDKQTFGFRMPSNGRRLYLSQVVVEFELSLNSLLNSFEQISSNLSNLIEVSMKSEVSPVFWTGPGATISGRTVVQESGRAGGRRNGSPMRRRSRLGWRWRRSRGAGH